MHTHTQRNSVGDVLVYHMRNVVLKLKVKHGVINVKIHFSKYACQYNVCPTFQILGIKGGNFKAVSCGVELSYGNIQCLSLDLAG